MRDISKLRKSGMGEVGQEWASIENTLGRAGGLSVEGGKKEGGPDAEGGYMGTLGWFMGGNAKVQDLSQGVDSATPDRFAGDRDAGAPYTYTLTLTHTQDASFSPSWLLCSFLYNLLVPYPIQSNPILSNILPLDSTLPLYRESSPSFICTLTRITLPFTMYGNNSTYTPAS